MIEATKGIALSLAEISKEQPGVAHERFSLLMEHAALEGSAFFKAAARDHSPLTDLRLKRDTNSKTMFHLNVRALLEAEENTGESASGLKVSNLSSSLSAIGAHISRADHVIAELAAREPQSGLTSADILVSTVLGSSGLSAQEVYVDLTKYVDAFGS